MTTSPRKEGVEVSSSSLGCRRLLPAFQLHYSPRCSLRFTQGPFPLAYHLLRPLKLAHPVSILWLKIGLRTPRWWEGEERSADPGHTDDTFLKRAALCGSLEMTLRLLSSCISAPRNRRYDPKQSACQLGGTPCTIRHPRLTRACAHKADRSQFTCTPLPAFVFSPHCLTRHISRNYACYLG